MDSILVSGFSSSNVIRFYKRWSDDILGEAIVKQKVVWDRLGDLQPRCILKLRHIFPTPTWFQRKQSSWSQHTSQFLRPAHSWLPLLCSWQVHPQYVGAYISSGFRVNGLPKHFLEKKALHKTKFTLQETNISPQNGILKMIFLFPRWDMLIPWRVMKIVTCTNLHHVEIQCFFHVLFWSHPRYWLVWWPLCTQRGAARRPQTQNGLPYVSRKWHAECHQGWTNYVNISIYICIFV